jgi:hypothetical protein
LNESNESNGEHVIHHFRILVGSLDVRKMTVSAAKEQKIPLFFSSPFLLPVPWTLDPSSILVVVIGTQQFLTFSFTLLPLLFAAMFLSRSLLSSVRSVAASKARFFHASSLCSAKLNLEGLAERVNLNGKNVLVRVDLNVPLAKVRGVYW